MIQRSRHIHRPKAATVQAPVYLMDETGKVRYVLLPAEQYRRVRPLLESEEFSIAQTYPLQEQVARGAGWNDAIMNDYDDYDRHHQKR